MNYWVKLMLCLSLIYTIYNYLQQLHHVVKGDFAEHQQNQLDKYNRLSQFVPSNFVQPIGLSVFSIKVLIGVQLLILVALS